MKKFVHVLGAILLVLVFLVATLVGYLTIDEYKPADVEIVEIEGKSSGTLSIDKPLTMMTWNLGYGALGDNADFFMDGGKMVYSADKNRVQENLKGIAKTIDAENPDIMLFQETDRNSSRSYFIDELDYIKENGNSAVLSSQDMYATNFNVSYVPLPIPPIGRVHAGLITLSTLEVSEASRLKLPSPFKWPLSTINLKRCLLESRFPIEGSDKELVLINLHLEAYDEGEGKIAQTNMLKNLLKEEIDKGNYVIAGGDFNQVFSNIDISAYPQLGVEWKPGKIDTSDFDSSLQFVTDATLPTCRSLDKSLADASLKDPEHFQYYVLDGFIVSSNIQIYAVTTIDTQFKFSDHNPVKMSFKLIN
ncbi:endonuclease/exonuclease/phosphatase family protein [Butyrivibrio sp. YAB3001]|uniref:endonuclease/exonuclease/phosphatase family protein n=1 Tax=Butyrivibrio sp. YAB3001 TaxID=1520812 RepID=UPI0008F68B5C|nr:endonuclease/exonuclease/phosphatase family protein [Butyrivibrio sp. YAB3001]SFB73357.1 Metal-dependent hydrolase, endonuclease/exonuclease/phosphatase family [Butyrivibrio sp. YAB3001]